MKALKELVRPNVWEMKPYSSARDEFTGEASVYLDANENPWNGPYNRYPDPLQRRLKERLAEIKGIAPDHIFIGNGSDEAIDISLRVFCVPSADTVVTITPSYGMYQVAADTHCVPCIKVPLTPQFALDADRLLSTAAERQAKMIFLCSPNNPSGNLLDRNDLYTVLDTFQGPVVIDEAYVDFSPQPSFLTELAAFPNLIVLQTLSKAWGAAGIRMGMAFAQPAIIALFNKVKYPYNMNQLTQEYAMKMLGDEEKMKHQLQQILAERTRMEQTLKEKPFGWCVYPSHANFILVRVGEANLIYNRLVEHGIVVRNRHSVALCEGCLRITIGTPHENDALLDALKKIIR